MPKEVIHTKDAPQPIVPLSQAIRANGFVFVCGMVSRDPATGKVVFDNIREQTERMLENVKAALTAAGTTLDKAVRATCYLKNREDFDGFNEVYRRYFPADPPARAVLMVDFVLPGVLVEIEVTALAS
jgi:2-iminobutanoate/2-iminopropanoate deaminase